MLCPGPLQVIGIQRALHLVAISLGLSGQFNGEVTGLDFRGQHSSPRYQDLALQWHLCITASEGTGTGL